LLKSKTESYQRYWKDTQTGKGGLGIGLYIAKGIVEAHGGNIWVESEVGKGCTFSCVLPINEAHMTDRDSAA
jgi:signal transduction histidine kinase